MRARASTSFALSTAMRTRSPPASRMDSACSTVASTSCVRVAHMLCSAMGWAEPTQAVPTRTERVGFLLNVIETRW